MRQFAGVVERVHPNVQLLWNWNRCVPLHGNVDMDLISRARGVQQIIEIADCALTVLLWRPGHKPGPGCVHQANVVCGLEVNDVTPHASAYDFLGYKHVRREDLG